MLCSHMIGKDWPNHLPLYPLQQRKLSCVHGLYKFNSISIFRVWVFGFVCVYCIFVSCVVSFLFVRLCAMCGSTWVRGEKHIKIHTVLITIMMRINFNYLIFIAVFVCAPASNVCLFLLRSFFYLFVFCFWRHIRYVRGWLLFLRFCWCSSNTIKCITFYGNTRLRYGNH